VTRVLVLSATATAINFIHSLRDVAGLQLFATDSNRYSPGLYCPWVTPIVVPRAGEREAYRQALDEAIASHGIDVLIPTSDYDVDAVVALVADGWDPPVRLFRPSAQQHANLGHKARLVRVLSGPLHQHVPRTWTPPVPPPGELPYPIVAKPIGLSGGRGVSVVERAAHLPAVLARLQREPGTSFLLQEFIPGRTCVLTMIYDESGRLVVSVAMRSHRTFFTWGGGGSAGELIVDPDLHELGRRIIEAAGGWRGPINLELRRHEHSGVWYVFEANCRLNGYSYLTTMNGLNLPLITVALLTGQPLPSLEPVGVEQRRNFVLGFREMQVDGWADDRFSGT
jgi:carbamoylphosphate synthase large subunit